MATSTLVALGFSVATYTAQNYGAGKISRIRRGVVRTSLVSLSFSIFIAFWFALAEKKWWIFLY